MNTIKKVKKLNELTYNWPILQGMFFGKLASLFHSKGIHAIDLQDIMQRKIEQKKVIFYYLEKGILNIHYLKSINDM